MPNKLTPPPPTGNGLLDRWLALLWRLLTAPGQLLKEQISDFAHNHTADNDGGALTNDLHDGYIEVATSAAPGTPASGKVRIYAQDAAGVGRLRVVHSSGSDLAMFRDAVVRVKNTSGVTINKGEIAYVTGATGNFPTIAKARANAAGTMPAAGMVLTTAADNTFTTLQFSGEMTGLDTSAFAEGARVFASATTAGAITATEPQHPNLSQAIGVITKSNAGAGSIQLFITLQHEGDDFGSNRNTFSIGDGGAGAKVLAFVNAFIGSLSWQPTAARTLTLPDETGTLVSTATANWVDLTDGGVTTLHSHSGGGGIGANLIINPFEVNQRALTSVGDDAYCLDRWYVLTESGNVTVAQITGPEAGAPWAIRLTQPDVSSKRFGLAQIIESKDICHLRSAAVNLSMRVKPSFAGNVRYAILEHTGTADSVTSDVVSNWASTTYTTSNFFIAGVNVIKTGTIAPGAATYGDLSDTGTFGASMNNAIVFVWTESAAAQNATLELNRPKLEAGSSKTDFVWRQDEFMLCRRYCRPVPEFVIGQAYATTAAFFTADTGVVMRATPTLSTSSGFSVFKSNGLEASCTVTITSLSDSALRLDTVDASGLVGGNACMLRKAAGSMLFAEL